VGVIGKNVLRSDTSCGEGLEGEIEEEDSSSFGKEKADAADAADAVIQRAVTRLEHIEAVIVEVIFEVIVEVVPSGITGLKLSPLKATLKPT